MTAPSWMLVRLALDTRQHHARADADRLALLDLTCELDYRRHLARIYGFEVAVEEALARAPGLPAELVTSRQKMRQLRADLEELGFREEQLERLPRPAVALQSTGQALGWMFVVERLTLLAGLIRRHLTRQLPAAPTAYLHAYGDNAGARFRELGEECSRHAQTDPVAPTAIVASANKAFHCQRDWFARLRSRPITPALAPLPALDESMSPTDKA